MSQDIDLPEESVLRSPQRILYRTRFPGHSSGVSEYDLGDDRRS